MTVVTDGVGKDILGQRKSLMLYADEPLLCFFPPLLHSQRCTLSSLPLTNSTALAFQCPSPPLPPRHPDQPTNLPACQLSRYVTRRGPKVPIRPISPLVQRVACAAASPSFSQQRTRHRPPSTPPTPPTGSSTGFFSLSCEETAGHVYIAKVRPGNAHFRHRRRLVKCSALGKRADRLARRDAPTGLQREAHNRLFILSIRASLSAFFFQ